MKTASMQDHLRDRMFNTSPEMFEVLCKMVIARRLTTESLQVTAFRQDEGIDIEGVIDEDMLRFLFGAQVKRYEEGNTVGSNYLQRFSGALNQANYQAGTYITSSSFTKPAEKTAEELKIHLVDGETLSSTMVENGIGVKWKGEECEIDEEFWQALEKPERDDVVPSNEVPLANSFESLRKFLKAIDQTDGSKQEIDTQIEEFEPRHADLYGTAGWLLGFVHKDTPKKVNGREVRRWGLTKEGVEYLRLHERDQSDQAQERLVEAIRQVEIIKRVHTEIEENKELSYQELRDVITDETALSESSVSRRASTVLQWLSVLPEIDEIPDGRSKKLVYK